MLCNDLHSMLLILICSVEILLAATENCQRLVWLKGMPNSVRCGVLGPITWAVGGHVVNTSDPQYRMIYGYVPHGNWLYVYHPMHKETIACQGRLEKRCYQIILERCKSNTCQNGGHCRTADFNTSIERVTCYCKHLSKGYRCEEKYDSMTWVTILLWLAVVFEVVMIAAAIHRNENQRIYKGLINRRFVDILRERDEWFQ